MIGTAINPLARVIANNLMKSAVEERVPRNQLGTSFSEPMLLQTLSPDDVKESKNHYCNCSIYCAENCNNFKFAVCGPSSPASASAIALSINSRHYVN